MARIIRLAEAMNNLGNAMAFVGSQYTRCHTGIWSLVDRSVKAGCRPAVRAANIDCPQA